MRRVERTQSVHGYDQLGMKSPEKASAAVKVGDPVVIGDKKVGIPPRKVSEDGLVARFAVADTALPAAVPQTSTGTPPRCWLEFTVENTASLTEDEIGEQLYFKGRFDASKFAIMLFLPNGEHLVTQMVNRMSGGFLLSSIGGDVVSADHFKYILFPEDYLDKIIVEIPTVEEIEELVRVESEPLPQGFPKERFEERSGIVAQAVVDTYGHKARREEFERRLQKIVDSIFGKLPPSDEENQVYWNNICEAVIEETVGEDGEGGEDGEARLIELEEKYPTLQAAMKAL
ncbi:MAG: hypothetical protein LBE98_03155 [Puniceicoccales bacterium]|jgi:hypothetical protein|nr:hypothetical protein [Puniceicoccales bacterium]